MSEGLHVSRWSRTVGHSLCAWCWGGVGSAPSPVLVHLKCTPIFTSKLEAEEQGHLGSRPGYQVGQGPCCILSPDKEHHCPQAGEALGQSSGRRRLYLSYIT